MGAGLLRASLHYLIKYSIKECFTLGGIEPSFSWSQDYPHHGPSTFIEDVWLKQKHLTSLGKKSPTSEISGCDHPADGSRDGDGGGARARDHEHVEVDAELLSQKRLQTRDAKMRHKLKFSPV